MAETDERLLALFNEKNEQALVELQNSCKRTAIRLAYDILHNREDAEECYNDGLLRVWNAIPPAAPASVRAFFLRTVRNRSLDMYRKRLADKRDGNADLGIALEELADCMPAMDDGENETALREYLSAFLNSEESENRALFVGRYWYATPVNELAKERGLSRFAVSRKLKATRERLRAYLRARGYHYDE